MEGKRVKLSHTIKGNKTTRSLQLVYSDVMETVSPKAYNDQQYVIS